MATVRIIVTAEDRASRPIRETGDAAGRADPQVRGFGSSLWEVGDAATNAGSLISEHVTAPFLDSIQVAGDFEANLLRFGSVTGGSLAEAGLAVGDFRDLFLQMGADTAFSAAQAGDAAIAMAKGGIAPAVIEAGGLAAVLGLAAAGELELAEAAEISAKQFGVWVQAGASAAEQTALLGEQANLMAQAANASVVDVSDLALGMANAGGSAKLAGLDFNETVTTLAMISPGFSSAADAGTSFKTFLANLQPTTTAQTDAMYDLGLMTDEGASKFYDAAGSFIGMEQAANLLQDATSGLSEAQRIQALQTIFGSDAIRAAAGIAEMGGEGFREMGADMVAMGSAAEQAAARNQGLNFATESLMGSVETLQIQLGEKLLPALTSVVEDALIPAVNWFGELGPTTQFAAIGFVGFIALLGPALLLIGGVASGITAITGLFSTFALLAPAFGAAWAIATGPVGLVVLGIAALVGAIAGLKWAWDNDFMGLQTSVSGWGDTLQRGMGVVSTFFTNWGSDIARGWTRLSDDARGLAGGVVATISGIPGLLGGVGWQIVDGIWSGLWGAWQNLLTNTDGLVGNFVGNFKSLLGIQSPSTVFRGMFRDVGEGAVLGLEDSAPAMLGAGADLAGGVVRSAEAALERGAPAGGATAVAGGETHYHLHIATNAPTEPIIQDFAMLRAMAGAGG